MRQYEQITCFCSKNGITGYLYIKQDGYNKFIDFLNILHKTNLHEITIDEFVTMVGDKNFSPVYKIILKKLNNNEISPEIIINLDTTKNILYVITNSAGILDIIDSINSLKYCASQNINEDINYMLAEWGNESCVLQNKIIEDDTIIVCQLKLYNVI